MKRIHFIFLLSITISFVSCSKNDSFNLEKDGTFLNANSKQITMELHKLYCAPPANDGYPCGPGTNCDEMNGNCLIGTRQNSNYSSRIADLDLQISNGNVTGFFNNSAKVSDVFPELLDSSVEAILYDLKNGVTTVQRVSLGGSDITYYCIVDPSTGEAVIYE